MNKQNPSVCGQHVVDNLRGLDYKSGYIDGLMDGIDYKKNHKWISGISTRYFSLHPYIQNVNVNRMKGLKFPKHRGTWLPSFDTQSNGGVAINWLKLRVRIGGWRKA